LNPKTVKFLRYMIFVKIKHFCPGSKAKKYNTKGSVAVLAQLIGEEPRLEVVPTNRY
jgi:hypothetical protein